MRVVTFLKKSENKMQLDFVTSKRILKEGTGFLK